MLATLVCEQKVFSVHLPEKCTGKYWIIDEEKPINTQKILSIEADESNGQWIIRNTKDVKLFEQKDNNLVQREQDIVLEEGHLYPLLLGKQQPQRVFLFAEPFTDDRSTFKKYNLLQDAVFNIGKSNENQIVIDSPFVSRCHAQLIYQNGTFAIRDNQNTNGVYVNRKRVAGSMELCPGDQVFILGFKIIIGNTYIALNNPGGNVTIRSDILRPMTVDSEEFVKEDLELESPDWYYRSPRFIRQITPVNLVVDLPTQKQPEEDTPIMLTLAPALLMGVASFSSGLVSTTNVINNGGKIISALPTMLMSISMLCGMVLFPFIMRTRDRKRKKQKEQERREKYLKYLQNIRNEIELNKNIQQKILRENNPMIMEQVNCTDFWERRLWGKTYEQEDFLFLRLGLGNAPMVGTVKFPQDRFSIDDDSLRDELGKFQKEEQILMNVPVGISLKEQRVVGIVGEKEGAFNMVNNMLLQIATLHSYADVKVILVCEKKDEERIHYAKWMQHIWDNEKKQRYFADSEDDARELTNLMNKIVFERKERVEHNEIRDGEVVLPHYVIISTSKYLESKCGFISTVLEDKTIPGFSVIAVYDESKELPKECEAIIEVQSNQGLMFVKNQTKDAKDAFIVDQINAQIATEIVQKTESYQLDLLQGKYDLPGMLTFLEMFGVGKIEHLNILNRWKENNPVMTIQTPVGLDTNGDIFYLDLHEKFHGPHGLVAGMTGSGKSEFIITYILSLAVNYHPNEVAFVLIDYKGGGLTGAFENDKYRLPHLAGTITNLDNSAVTRAILSIKSELRRRQQVFNHACSVANEGTMDIYKYQKMFRDGLVTEPVPHLFIISDEFAELKSQQPEFMEQLISTARIGRSLGVHLILATQKPAGVVSDQIWSNSKFKVCLKVQDRADSMEMLKRPEAAEIVETGRFYLQVGYNELFEKGQSAWCGAPYKAEDVVTTELDGNIEILDNTGNVTDKIKNQSNSSVKTDGKQIVRIMEYLDRLAKDENIVERQLWLPEIPSDIVLDDVLKKEQYQEKYQKRYKPEKRVNPELACVIGEMDDPYRQKQWLMEVDFTASGNVLVYGAAGSGKEQLLATMLYFLYNHYDSTELNTYILDFGAETLRMFESAPQTGEVMIDGDSEKIANFFTFIKKEVKYRKKLFSEFGGDYESYYRSDNDKIPYILIIINNYTHFDESYESYGEDLLSLTRECCKYGIFVVMSSNSASGIGYRLNQNFQNLLVMHMNTRDDYISVVGTTGGIYPPAIAGRGMVKRDEVYIFPTAYICKDTSKILTTVKENCAQLLQKSNGVHAKRIPVMPKFISGLSLTNRVTGMQQIPIGVSYDNFDYVNHDLEKNNILFFGAKNVNDATMVAGGLLETVSGIPNLEIVVVNGGKELNDQVDISYKDIAGEEITDTLKTIRQLAVARNNNYKTNNGQFTIEAHPILYVLVNIPVINKATDMQTYSEFAEALYRAEGFTNLYFVVCDSYDNMKTYQSYPWFQNRCRNELYWVGNGLADCSAVFTLKNDSMSLRKMMDNNMGYKIEKNMAKKMKFVMPTKCEEEDDENE